MHDYHLTRRPAQETDVDIPQMLTYAEAAARLKVDKRTIRRRVAAGRYVAYGEGSGKRLLSDSILADIQRNSGVR